MKKTMKFAAMIAAVVAICSCGATKKAISNQMTQSAQAYPQSTEVSATTANKVPYSEERTEEIQDPWYELQSQATDHLRGAGDAVSTIKTVAMEQAKTIATNNLAEQISSACESARRMILHDMGLNDEHSASTEFAQDIKIKIQQQIGMNHALMSKTYRLANGSYQCGYCFELDMTKTELKDYLAKEIVKDATETYKNIKGLNSIGQEMVKEKTQRAKDLLNF